MMECSHIGCNGGLAFCKQVGNTDWEMDKLSLGKFGRNRWWLHRWGDVLAQTMGAQVFFMGELS
jgi:hypothetical protein